ncbi:MAG: carboxypeptidase-like regulatory domain-containing protein [Proteobacteria bacterium]|nr:carboxypeptidase-like regulatory domain-containing protein [Pseudomonadota bacterium]
MRKFLIFLIVFLAFACSKNIFFEKYEHAQTGIMGRVLDEKNLPVPNAYVYLYRSLSSGLMGPADFMEKTDERGNFFFDVPEGKYYLVVRKRVSGLDSGPLRQGDRVSIYSKNPIILNPKEIKSINITLPSKTQVLQKKSPTGDSTIVVRLKGESSEKKRFYLLIYEGDKEKKSPDFIQEITGDTTTINLPSNKTFNIVVRESMKDKIEKNELYGRFGPFVSENVREITIEIEKHP